MNYKMNYKNMKVWQKSMDLVCDIYKEVKLFPKEEMYGLSDQMRRAVVSIPSNIAEGSARNSDKDFRRFLLIAKGSAAELETQLLICQKLNYITQADSNIYLDKVDHVKRMLSLLINQMV